MKTYKITYFKLFKESILYIINLGIFLIIGISSFFPKLLERFEIEKEATILIIIMSIVLITFISIYPLYLIYNYYQYDKDTTLSIDTETLKAVYVRKGKTFNFNINKIRYGIIYCKFYFIPARYYEIILDNKISFKLTYLVFDNIKKYNLNTPAYNDQENWPLLFRKADD